MIRTLQPQQKPSKNSHLLAKFSLVLGLCLGAFLGFTAGTYQERETWEQWTLDKNLGGYNGKTGLYERFDFPKCSLNQSDETKTKKH